MDQVTYSTPLARSTMAYVLAGGRGSRLMELTERRAKPAVYFGGKSRIIDFALSNALNSGIRRIAVATQYKAHSLIRHLQRGWNFLQPVRNESFDILPASQRVAEDQWYAGTADAVFQNIDIIDGYAPEYLVILAGDHVYKMDYERMLVQHVNSGADVTVGCIEVPAAEGQAFGIMHVDDTDRIVSFVEKPETPPEMPDRPGWALASMGIYVFRRDLLNEQLKRDAADPHSTRDFGRDIIPYLVRHGKAVAHRLARSCVRSRDEAEVYWRDVGTIDAYWEANIDLTDVVPALDLYDRNWPIWTYAEITPPAKFVHDEEGRRGIGISSLISGGCIVSGSSLRHSLAVHRSPPALLRRRAECGHPSLRGHRPGRTTHQRDRRRRRQDSGRPRGRRGPRGRRRALPPHAARHLPRHAADDRPAASVKRLRVLSVASEVYPLLKTGGLADVVAALPPALAREGIATRTLVPGYPAVLAAVDGAEVVHAMAALHGGPARVLAAHVAGLDLFVLDAPHLYRRPGNPYLGPDGKDWPDNAVRFAALAEGAAAIALGGVAGFAPDIVQAHDWQAGLVPALLHYGGTPRPRTVMTLHNLSFQGQFPRELLATIGLPAHAWSIDGVEYHGTIGYLKAGLALADRITTVSPTYAAEIRTPEGGMGLDGLLRQRAGVLTGIRNGIDDTVWNPATDAHLAARFDAKHLARRAPNKTALRARFGLDADPAAFVCGVVSRLTLQKGMDLLLDALPALTAHGAQLALLGSGERSLEAGFVAAADRFPGRVAALTGYDESVAHLVQAGADALLVPSRFEPCGLTQLCALRYGAMPIVARVGGLADTVVDANEMALAADAGTGLQFAPVTRQNLEFALGRAIALARDRALWRRLQARAMATDVGWTRPAKRYAALFRDLAKRGAT